MYATVKTLTGYSDPLTYTIPASWDTHHLVGALVRVPMRTKVVTGIVVAVHESLSFTPSFTIKPLYALEQFPRDPAYYQFITNLSRYYQLDPTTLIRRIQHFLTQKEHEERDALIDDGARPHVTLSPAQQAIVDALTPAITTGQYTPALLHGVTGSGKTEVYKQLILHAVRSNKTAILLLPEVTLAVYFEHLLREQIPTDVPMYGFHSASSMRTKKEAWRALIEGAPIVLIGVHLPIMLPISNLGLIVVDEEHEVGYQEKKHPKINSKDAALWRAQLAHIPIVLGSATPSISSLYQVKTKGWKFFQLTQRFTGTLPTIQVVALDKKQRRHFWISRELELAIADRLRKKEQCIIFLNRRGFSFFVQCGQCNTVFNCSQCSVSLTLHADNRLACHYCHFNQALPNACATCSASSDTFLKKGIGTQQVVSILQKIFPTARIGRADLDSTVNKKRWQETIHAMRAGTIDILVGTQTITKGHHFPQVTLVGVLWADLNLHFPVYNAGETTLQQLIQVAGRAGRSTKKGHVIVQTMIDHPIFTHLNEADYATFYETELSHRQALGYPPCKRLIEVSLKHTEESQVESDATTLCRRLSELALSRDIIVLGPAKPPVHKVQNVYQRKIYMKGESMRALIEIFEVVKQDDLNSSIFFTPNPLSL